MKIRTEARRQAILAAAAKLFREVGYERASMNELAKRHGGSKATLYGYFESKEALFVAVVRASSTAHLTEAIKELDVDAEGADALQSTLLRFAERMLTVLANDESAIELYRVVVAEAKHSGVGEMFLDAGPVEAHAALARFLSRAMRRGDVREMNAKLLAMQFTSLVVAEAQTRILERDPKPLTASQIRKAASRAVDVFFNGVGA